MRTCTVYNRSGLIVARGMAQNDGKVFVLFDGDDKNESTAGWFHVDYVRVTGTVPVNI
ncbi:hypothetical protein [Alkalihalobacillus sp. TS-13]|uniref:hypothetical protein n=1 Tax=Alkalihalobacillus sp. TS-13 TaxID=2842455 RepID=UPI001C881638|nr:hypothetical protein [Alkalihalobacillus sp. TS-13]